MRIYLSLVLMAYFSLMGEWLIASEIAPPKYNMIDRMNVNMATGQLQIAMTDLAIGGERGISHVIAQHSSDFFGGFNDNFRGSAQSKLHLAGGSISDQFSIVRVSAGGVTADFSYTNSGGSYVYNAVNDPRNELAYIAGTGLVFTQADGTQAVYAQTYNGAAISSYNPTSSPMLRLTRILYPTGLQFSMYYKSATTIYDYPPLLSVRTNTGFQLKYQYVDDNRPLDGAKQNSSMESGMPADSLAWSRGNPKSIVALNNSYEHCNVSTAFCNLNYTWPTVTYQWPAGMPRAMAVGQSTFSVTDPEGRTSHFHHTAIDKAFQLPDGQWLAGIAPNTQSEPRITSVDFPQSSPISYEYENRVIQNHPSNGQGLRYPRWFPDGYGVLKKAIHGAEVMSYTPMIDLQGYDSKNASVGYHAVEDVDHNNQKGVIRRVETHDKIIRREDSFHNKIRDVYDKKSGLYYTYEYDSRLNITAVNERDADYHSSPSYEVTVSRAQYPGTCTTGNRKYCNKPTWTEDANGHRTNYTYHAPSGMVASKTLPADERGIRPQIRFSYVQLTPTHSGADHSPVWVLSKEEYCRNSAASGSSCSGGDETQIIYEYETENLLMTGKAVVAEGKTLRTCFGYDRFARKISEIEPNAQLSSCNN